MQTLTIKLTDAIYSQLRRAAELAHQPLDVVVEQSLAHSLPPLLEEIPPAYQSDVYPLLEMSDTELNAEARRQFPAAQWDEYEALLSKKKEASLTTPEQARLDALCREADVLTFRKGYAAVLLKRRGQPVLFNTPQTFASLRGVWAGVVMSEQDLQASRLALPEDLL